MNGFIIKSPKKRFRGRHLGRGAAWYFTGKKILSKSEVKGGGAGIQDLVVKVKYGKGDGLSRRGIFGTAGDGKEGQGREGWKGKSSTFWGKGTREHRRVPADSMGKKRGIPEGRKRKEVHFSHGWAGPGEGDERKEATPL